MSINVEKDNLPPGDYIVEVAKDGSSSYRPVYIPIEDKDNTRACCCIYEQDLPSYYFPPEESTP